MDIIEGLDLSDAAADGLGFSLDDILEEFKTTIPAKPAPEPPPRRIRRPGRWSWTQLNMMTWMMT